MAFYQDRRYSRVPWLSDDADLQRQPGVGSVVEIGDSIIWGLHVKAPFGPGTDAMVAVSAQGAGTGGLAITGELNIVHPVEPAQSNPNRSGRDDWND